jgi:hypothetical protein
MKANRRQAVFLFSAALVSGLICSVAIAGNPHGTAPGQANQQQTTTSDNSAGIKPSNDTKKDQTCMTGGGQGSSATCTSTTSSKSDASKRYGNGKTAAQIANGKGAPSGTPVYGPGNSQPHKICGRDVHAYKGANDKKCPSSSQSGTQAGTQSGSTNSSLNAAGTSNAAGTNGTGSTAGTSASSGNPSGANGVLGASHTTSGKPVAGRAKPAQAVLGTASCTG